MSEIKMLAELVPCEVFFLGLKTAIFFLHPHLVFPLCVISALISFFKCHFIILYLLYRGDSL
jgi:hypothetical protein